MQVRWYALRSKPNREELLSEQLGLRGIEVFYPRIRVRVVNPRARRIKPYFPGYLFVHIDLSQIGESTLQWVPGTTGLVSFGGEPAYVPDNLIHAIRTRVEENNTVRREIPISFKPGDPVLIQDGPFKGYEAIFDSRISGNERVRVLLQLFQDRCVPLTLRSGQIAGLQHSV
jgi:transcription elongation factor/antiterminator RfaH